MSQPYYLQGSPFAVRMNSLIGWLARHGVSLLGSQELSVRGRKSGQLQRIPVNPHTHEGVQYLVSARGHSQWVRNMRAAGGGELRVGRRTRAFTAVEIADDEQKMIIIRAYLERWGWRSTSTSRASRPSPPTVNCWWHAPTTPSSGSPSS